MAEALPVIYLARYGETAWSLSGQNTGRTDLPLTESGERNARALGARLRGLASTKTFTSPLQRAVKTRELAGFVGTARLATNTTSPSRPSGCGTTRVTWKGHERWPN